MDSTGEDQEISYGICDGACNARINKKAGPRISADRLFYITGSRLLDFERVTQY